MAHFGDFCLVHAVRAPTEAGAVEHVGARCAGDAAIGFDAEGAVVNTLFAQNGVVLIEARDGEASESAVGKSSQV